MSETTSTSNSNLMELLYAQNLPVISFVKNWNEKLDCECFTTIRAHIPKRYISGRHFQIKLNGERKGVAVCLDVKRLRLGDLNEWQARLDTGLSREEAVKLFKTFYADANFDT